MKVKIDTKEKFTVITPETETLGDNFTEALKQAATVNENLFNSNIVLNLKHIANITDDAAEQLAALQQQAYNQSFSFVICALQPQVEEKLEQLELAEMMNITPTESEAWDIVQMEEIERELLDGDDFEFDKNSD